jgi:SseB protein N-terminal domain
MGLFSRRPKNDTPAETPDEQRDAAAAPSDTPADQTPAPAETAAGATPATAPAPTAADPALTAATPTPAAANHANEAPALVVNTLVQSALQVWAQKKGAQTMFEVLRQCATGELLLDISASQLADSAKGFQPGDSIAISHEVDNAGKKLLLAFTSNERLAAYRTDRTPASLAQPATAVLKQAITDYEGIVIDPRSADSCIAYAPEITQGLTADPAVNEALKAATAGRASSAELFAVASQAPGVFVATKDTKNEAGEVVSITVQNVTTSTGERFAAAFTSPAEVWAWGTEFNARPTALANVTRVMRENGQVGIVLNPGGPAGIIPASELESIQ